MVFNKRGGKKTKKQASSGSKTSGRSLEVKDNAPDSSQLYGKVIKRCGGNPPQILILCEDGMERICVVRGKMTKKVWMNVGDIVIITYNKDSSKNTGEIAHKYEPHEVSKLEKMGEITQDKFKGENDILTTDENNFVFVKEEDTKNNDVEHSSMNTGIAHRVNIANLDDTDDDDEEFNINDIKNI